MVSAVFCCPFKYFLNRRLYHLVDNLPVCYLTYHSMDPLLLGKERGREETPFARTLPLAACSPVSLRWSLSPRGLVPPSQPSAPRCWANASPTHSTARRLLVGPRGADVSIDRTLGPGLIFYLHEHHMVIQGTSYVQQSVAKSQLSSTHLWLYQVKKLIQGVQNSHGT